MNCSGKFKPQDIKGYDCMCIVFLLRKREFVVSLFDGFSQHCVSLTMGHQLAPTEQNTERILAVQALFGTSGKPLAKPGRVLVGEGHLLKLCRRSPKPKAFFLFNDILVYGSIVILGRWYTNQQVIPLEDVSLEDMEDGLQMKNQWLIRTPRKSFYVSAASPEEKQAWMEHITECQAKRLQRMGRSAGTRFAAVWVPDQASAICMRCCVRFSRVQRRHHCRHCGFVVCASCSRTRFIIPEISAKPVRVCQPCHSSLWRQAPHVAQMVQPATQMYRSCGNIARKNSSDEELLNEPSNTVGTNGTRYAYPVHTEWESPTHVQNSSWSSYIDVTKLQLSNMGNF
ncbi:hypothetical protein GJAV_G00244590 [Gymnothorax javanicus]|nr:hypothetical protein GJAV_G00244590 [Gymnothorax javanicus]